MDKTLICHTPFNLNTPEGMKRFKIGDKVQGKDAEHWYAKAHCSETQKEAEKQAERDPIQDALKTKELVKSLITEDQPKPNMKELNAALAEADLPKLENAEARDLILADIEKEAAAKAE